MGRDIPLNNKRLRDLPEYSILHAITHEFNVSSLSLTKSVAKSNPACLRRTPYMDDESNGLPSSLASCKWRIATSATGSLAPASAAQLMPCPTSLSARFRSDHGRSPGAGMYAPVVRRRDMECARGPNCCSKRDSIAWEPRPVFSAKTWASATSSIIPAFTKLLSMGLDISRVHMRDGIEMEEGELTRPS